MRTCPETKLHQSTWRNTHILFMVMEMIYLVLRSASQVNTSTMFQITYLWCLLGISIQFYQLCGDVVSLPIPPSDCLQTIAFFRRQLLPHKGELLINTLWNSNFDLFRLHGIAINIRSQRAPKGMGAMGIERRWGRILKHKQEQLRS